MKVALLALPKEQQPVLLAGVLEPDFQQVFDVLRVASHSDGELVIA